MRGWRRVVAAGIAASAVLPVVSVAPAFALPAGCSQVANTVTCTYSYTGDEQQFTVPTGVTSINITGIAGKGGAGFLPGSFDGTPGVGGFGATVTGTISVTPGETLFVEVGGNGTSNSAGGAGGFNGGGNGSSIGGFASGGGGGASDVRTVSCGSPCDTLEATSLASRLLVAGGGGGGGAAFNVDGGPGGSAGVAPQAGTDGDDVPGFAGSGGKGGGAGSQSLGGSGGDAGTGDFPAGSGTDGSAGQGGSGQVGAFTQNAGGGGGGG